MWAGLINNRAIPHIFLLGVEIILGLIALSFCLYHWEFFVRCYYELTPHPATSMVKQAIAEGVEFDQRAFTDIIRDRPHTRAGQAVRNEQAAALAEMARMSNEQLRRKAEELRQRVEDEAKYQAAHGELLREIFEQQLAKERADAYAKAEEFWRSRRKGENVDGRR